MHKRREIDFLETLFAIRLRCVVLVEIYSLFKTKHAYVKRLNMVKRKNSGAVRTQTTRWHASVQLAENTAPEVFLTHRQRGPNRSTVTFVYVGNKSRAMTWRWRNNGYCKKSCLVR